MTGGFDDIIYFIGESMVHIFTAFDAVYILDTGLSILDLWIVTMLIGAVMDFISNYIEGYYS